MSISATLFSLLLTTHTIPANGWLDRIEAKCPTNDCTLSVLTENRQRGGDCPEDSVLQSNGGEVHQRLQGLGADLFGWEEYVTEDGTVCVHMTSPEKTRLNAQESDLFLGVMLAASLQPILDDGTDTLAGLNQQTNSAHIDDQIARTAIGQINCGIINPDPNYPLYPLRPATLRVPVARTLTSSECKGPSPTVGTSQTPYQGSGVFLSSRIFLTAAHVTKGQLQNCIVYKKLRSGSGVVAIKKHLEFADWQQNNQNAAESVAFDLSVVLPEKAVPLEQLPKLLPLSNSSTIEIAPVRVDGYPGGDPHTLSDFFTGFCPVCPRIDCAHTSFNPAVPPTIQNSNFFRAFRTATLPQDVVGLSGGPMIQTFHFGNPPQLQERLIGIASSALTRSGIPYIAGPSFDDGGAKKREIERLANMLLAQGSAGFAIDLLVGSLTPFTTRLQTKTLKAMFQGQNRRVTEADTSIFWVDDENNLLGTGPTLTISAQNKENGEYGVNLGSLRDGPYAARFEYSVEIPKANLELGHYVCSSSTTECMLSVNVQSEFLTARTLYALPSNTKLASDMSQPGVLRILVGYNQFKVPPGTNQLKLVNEDTQNVHNQYALISVNPISSTPSIIFPNGRECTVNLINNTCVIMFTKALGSWPFYVDAEWRPINENGIGLSHWRHLSPQSTTSMNAQISMESTIVEVRLISGVTGSFINAVDRFILRKRLASHTEPTISVSRTTWPASNPSNCYGAIESNYPQLSVSHTFQEMAGIFVNNEVQFSGSEALYQNIQAGLTLFPIRSLPSSGVNFAWNTSYSIEKHEYCVRPNGTTNVLCENVFVKLDRNSGYCSIIGPDQLPASGSIQLPQDKVIINPGESFTLNISWNTTNTSNIELVRSPGGLVSLLLNGSASQTFEYSDSHRLFKYILNDRDSGQRLDMKPFWALPPSKITISPQSGTWITENGTCSNFPQELDVQISVSNSLDSRAILMQGTKSATTFPESYGMDYNNYQFRLLSAGLTSGPANSSSKLYLTDHTFGAYSGVLLDLNLRAETQIINGESKTVCSYSATTP